MKYLCTFCLSLYCLIGQSLNITLQNNHFTCGTTVVSAQTGCNHNGTLAILVTGNPSGIQVSNISQITGGNFTFEVNVTPEAPQNAQFLFTILTSNDPTGCALPNASESENITIDCACTMTLSGLVTNESCFQCNDGVVVTEVENGSEPIDYLWSHGLTTASVSNLSPGTYSATATDINGCEATTTFVVAPYHCAGFTVLSTINNALCYDDCNGSIQINGLSNGSTAFIAVWNEGQTTTFLGDLCAATYHVTITDQDLCTATQSFTVQQLPKVDIIIDSIVHATPSLPGKVFFSIETENDQNPSCQGCSCCTGFCGICGEITDKKSSVSNLEADKYFIQLAYENGCIVMSDTFEVEFISGVKNLRDDNIFLFPNPAEEYIEVSHPDVNDVEEFTILNITGKVMKKSKNHKILVRDFPAGFYFMTFSTDRGRYILPFNVIK